MTQWLILFQGVVSGVLLVTPNAVMFDPNVMDTLVMEHGSESYAVIAPMEFVVNAAIYHDIAHMRVGHTDQQHSLTKWVLTIYAFHSNRSRWKYIVVIFKVGDTHLGVRHVQGLFVFLLLSQACESSFLISFIEKQRKSQKTLDSILRSVCVSTRYGSLNVT